MIKHSIPLLLLAFLLYIILSCKRKKEETFMEYFEDGKLKSENTLIDDSREGKAKTFYENGKIKEIFYYKENQLNGDFISYAETGEIDAKGFFWNGKAVGPTWYYYLNGLPKLYNEWNYAGRTYYIKKYDSSGHLLKEEGVCLSKEIEQPTKDKIIFFYSEPEKYFNDLKIFINDKAIPFSKNSHHVGEILIPHTTVSTPVIIRIYSTLKKEDNSIVCQDSVIKKVAMLPNN